MAAPLILIPHCELNPMGLSFMSLILVNSNILDVFVKYFDGSPRICPH